ncbi:UDP-glucuronosyl and UDP-glucosyl transferase [Handroanthus impetiginosus]|uniref:UDP-glucuronosyl and UDP-glucosyl transferase n=1 Tax=Handroanthus impetiginosus TaxID=429701 RepID=A0A2G9H0T9_9LAMI|nr:UDP-glucuronosyl and UDP-glucosyl transferase [Handroanthus impetiginosus]
MALQREQLHFLLTPLMSQSHIIPLTDFAKSLAKHGPWISIVMTPLNAIRYKAVIDHAKAQRLKIQLIPIKFPCQEAGLPDGCENLDTLNSLELSGKFLRACELLQGPLETIIQELEPKPNCIISTSAISWAQKVAQKFKIPRYLFETISCFTALCSNLLSQINVQENVEPILVPKIPHKIEFTKAQLPEFKDSYVLKRIMDQMKQARDSAKGTLVNSFEELESWCVEEWRKERGNVWCIGPVFLCNKEPLCGRGNKASIDEHYCQTRLNSKKPKSVIYACFETGLGLERSNFPFIWIIKKREDYSDEVEKWLVEEGLEERARGRGLIIREWAPQVLILAHPSIGEFLTHCGWNSTLEGIYAGVPMITWPMFSEQFYNEKFIVNVLGIGARVGVKSFMNYEKNEDLVKWDKVKNAIEKVTDESEEGIKIRERAQEIAEMARNSVEKGGLSYLNKSLFTFTIFRNVSWLYLFIFFSKKKKEFCISPRLGKEKEIGMGKRKRGGHGASAKQAGALIPLYRSIGHTDTREKTVRKRPSSSPSVQILMSPDLIQQLLPNEFNSSKGFEGMSIT